MSGRPRQSAEARAASHLPPRDVRVIDENVLQMTVRSEMRAMVASVLSVVESALGPARPRVLPDILTDPVPAPPPPEPEPEEKEPPMVGALALLFKKRLQVLVACKRAYAVDLRRTFEPGSAEYEYQRGLVGGMQMAFDVLCKQEKIEIPDDPPRLDPLSVMPATTAPTSGTTPSLSRLERGLLGTLLSAKRPLSRVELSILSRYAPSGDVSTAMARLRREGLVEDTLSDRCTASARGAEVFTADGSTVEPLPSKAELRRAWIEKFDTLTGNLLSASCDLAATHHGVIPRHALLTHAGYRPSGDVSSAIGRLRRLHLLDKGHRPHPELL